MIVAFTKNITPENRAAGIAALDIFFRNSIFQVIPYNMFTSLKGLISYLDEKYPTYIEFLGETAKSITSEQLTQAMLNVSRNGKKSYPAPQDFSNGIMAATNGNLRADVLQGMKIISDTAIESGKEILSMGQTFIKYLPQIALGTVALVIFLKLGGGSALAKNIGGARRANPSKRKKK